MNDDEPFIPGMSRRQFLELAAAHAINPSASPRQISSFFASASPALFAVHASQGDWVLAPHLAILNRLLQKCAARKIRRLIVTCPPRHGKSSFISRYLPAWWLGTFPNERVILACYGSSLASHWSAKARETFSTYGPRLFGRGIATNSRRVSDWSVQGYEGGMVAAGVNGPMTGRGANLLIIDDPVKGHEEADSDLMREKTWEWFTSTAFTRLEPNGVCIVIQTRWHQDDLTGRLLSNPTGGEPWTVLNLPAIAEEYEPSFPHSMGRRPGQALWPARYPLAALEEIRVGMSSRWWSALYQQRPTPKGGGIFHREWWPIVNTFPTPLKTVRFWDLASTEAQSGHDPDWTAGVKMSRCVDGNYYLRDIRHDRLSVARVEDLIIQTAKLDGKEVLVKIEQEGGSSGKIAIKHYKDRFNRELPGWSLEGIPSSGSKVVRAEPLAAAAEHEYVRLVVGDWSVESFLKESSEFPHGKHDDQVDAASGAYSKIFIGRPSRTVSSPIADTRRVINEYQPR